MGAGPRSPDSVGTVLLHFDKCPVLSRSLNTNPRAAILVVELETEAFSYSPFLSSESPSRQKAEPLVVRVQMLAQIVNFLVSLYLIFILSVVISTTG